VGPKLLLALLGGLATAAQANPTCSVPSGTQAVEFEAGQNTLRGFIDLPRAPGKHPLILIVHGSGSTDVTRREGYNGSYNELRAAFREAGFATAIWDNAGNGCSEGSYSVYTPLVERTDETVAAIDHLKSRGDIDSARIGLWSISTGGWIAPMAAVRRPEIAFLIIVSGPGRDTAAQMEYFAFNRLLQTGVHAAEARQAVAVLHRAYAIASAGASRAEFLAAIEPLEKYPVFGREFGITETPEMKTSPEAARTYQAHQRARDYTLSADTYLRALHQPTLAIFGDRDVQVDWRTSVKIYRESFELAGNRDLTVKIFKNAGHNLTGEDGSGFVHGYVETMVNWLRARK
jgi:uncharacterized protein